MASNTLDYIYSTNVLVVMSSPDFDLEEVFSFFLDVITEDSLFDMTLSEYESLSTEEQGVLFDRFMLEYYMPTLHTLFMYELDLTSKTVGPVKASIFAKDDFDIERYKTLNELYEDLIEPLISSDESVNFLAQVYNGDLMFSLRSNTAGLDILIKSINDTSIMWQHRGDEEVRQYA